MKPIILYYMLDEVTLILLKQLNVCLIEIKQTDGLQTMGALLRLPHFKRNNQTLLVSQSQPFLYFAFMDQKTTFAIIDLLKQNQIYIPYKAMMTPTNINYTFNELYQHVVSEHALMKGKK